MLWSEEQIADLKRRWAANETARDIGTAIGVGRNAVLGKIHRLGLSTRINRKPIHRVEHVGARRNGGAIKSALKAKRAREREIAARANQVPLMNVVLARARAMGELPECEAVDLPTEQICREPVALVDLLHFHCRWPVDVDGETMFCGADKHTGAYCEHHAKMAYRPYIQRCISPITREMAKQKTIQSVFKVKLPNFNRGVPKYFLST